MEKTPSFLIYPDTNSFYCFGCGSGTFTVDLVSLLDSIPKEEAAAKILELFCGDDYKNIVTVANDFSKEKVDLYFKFSNMIYEFNKSFEYSSEAITYSEKICKVFDDLNTKHNMEPKAITSLIEKLEKYLKKYT